jgi:hypothetical protein
MAVVTAFSHTNNTMNARVYLVVLAWLLLPLTTTHAVLCSFYGRTYNLLHRGARKSRPNHRTILISDSSLSAVSLARSLKASGHHVIGAALTRSTFSSTRFSASFDSFHRLQNKLQWQRRQIPLVLFGIKIKFAITLPLLFQPVPLKSMELAQEMLSLIQRQEPDLWIPCSSSYLGANETDIQQAIEAVRGHTSIGILQADLDTAEMLADEAAFTEYVEQLEIDIRAPEYHIVTSRDEVHKIVATNQSISRWELEEDLDATVATSTKKLDFEDVSKRRYTWPGPPKDTMTPPHSSKTSPTQAVHPMTYEKVVLPLHSTNATYQCVAGMAISHEHPWIMREIIFGQKITAHLLVIHNELRAFVASFPNETTTFGEEAEVIPTTSSLCRPLLLFAEAFTNSLPEETSSFFSINFVVSGVATTVGTCNTIFATSCFVGPQSAAPTLLTLSEGQLALVAGAITDLASSATDDTSSHASGSNAPWSSKAVVFPPSVNRSSTTLRGVYSFYPALLDLVILPLFRLFMGSGTVLSFFEDMLSFCEKVLLWKEELFHFTDPWPWWWEWNVRQPLMLFAEVFG